MLVLASTLSRAFSHNGIEKRAGKPIIVDSRPGAAGTTGAQSVLQEDPDGYTVLLAPAAPLVKVPLLTDTIPYDADTDFVPIVELVVSPIMILSNKSVSANNLTEMVEIAPANAGDVSIGNSGLGQLNNCTMTGGVTSLMSMACGNLASGYWKGQRQSNSVDGGPSLQMRFVKSFELNRDPSGGHFLKPKMLALRPFYPCQTPRPTHIQWHVGCSKCKMASFTRPLLPKLFDCVKSFFRCGSSRLRMA